MNFCKKICSCLYKDNHMNNETNIIYNNEYNHVNIFQNKQTQNFNTCSICLEDMKYNDICMIISCSHIYHKECLELWMSKKTICPLCDYQF